VTDNKTEFVRAEVKSKITVDVVLDLYEEALEETDPVKQKAFMEAVKVLSQNVDTYLVTTEKDD
jgi:hypothetical protein